MAQVFDAIFEDGVLKPLEHVELTDHQQVRVAILPSTDVVKRSQGIIRAPSEIVKEVVEGDEYSPWS